MTLHSPAKLVTAFFSIPMLGGGTGTVAPEITAPVVSVTLIMTAVSTLCACNGILGTTRERK